MEPGTWGQELLRLFALGVPVAGTQLAFMLLGVVDTAMLGHFDGAALAAAGIGNLWHWAVTSLAFGIVLGVEAFISQAYGRGDAEGVALGLQRGLLTAVLCSFPVGLAQALAEPLLLLVGQEARLAADAGWYCLLRLPSVPCFLVYMALRVYLQGRNIVWPAFWAALVCNASNAALNWVLIYGKLGAPALGLTGAALASSLTSLSLPLSLYLWCRWRRQFTGYTRRWDAQSWSRKGLLQVLTLGLPIGLHTALEGWAFGLASVLAGWIGVTELASYQITLNVAGLLFMVPLGLSIGASTRVGNLLGAGNLPAARRAMLISLASAAGWAALSGTSILLAGDRIPALFTDEAELLRAVLVSLPAVAAFQLFDSTQAVGAGLLRAMGRPHAGALINAFGFFCIALPLAYWWGIRAEGGIVALWWSMCLGLTLVALGVCSWAMRLSRLELHQLQVKLS